MLEPFWFVADEVHGRAAISVWQSPEAPSFRTRNLPVPRAGASTRRGGTRPTLDSYAGSSIMSLYACANKVRNKQGPSLDTSKNLRPSSDIRSKMSYANEVQFKSHVRGFLAWLYTYPGF
eukprot:jgi/Botrbrau1/22160/Bobra.0206s0083.1